MAKCLLAAEKVIFACRRRGIMYFHVAGGYGSYVGFEREKQAGAGRSPRKNNAGKQNVFRAGRGENVAARGRSTNTAKLTNAAKSANVIKRANTAKRTPTAKSTNTTRTANSKRAENVTQVNPMRSLRQQSGAAGRMKTSHTRLQRQNQEQRQRQRARRHGQQPEILQRNISAFQNLPQRNKWIFLLVSLAVIIALTVGGFVYVKSQLTAYHESKTEPKAGAEFNPVACTAENLAVELNVAQQESGAGAVFHVTYTNKSQAKAPCYIDAGYENVALQVVSGNEYIWNSQTCASGVKNKQLLISQGVSSRQAYSWNGIVAGMDCAGQSLAKAGTYRVGLSIAGKTVVDNSPFVINKNGTISIPAAAAPSAN